MRLIREGRVEEAAEAFLEYGHKTGSAAHYYNAALAYSELGKSSMAIQALQAAVGNNPTFWDAWINFGVFFQQSEEFLLANRCYRLAARSSDPHRRALAFYNIGAMNLRSANIQRAHSAFLAATRADPGLAVAADGLGAVYWRRGRARAAQAMFARALASQPDLAEAYFNLGNLERGRGNWFKAVEFLSAAAAGVARGSSNPTLFWAQVLLCGFFSLASLSSSSLWSLSLLLFGLPRSAPSWLAEAVVSRGSAASLTSADTGFVQVYNNLGGGLHALERCGRGSETALPPGRRGGRGSS